MSVLLQLFWSFLKIGFTSFGGLSMIPLINGEMLSHGWMTAAEVTDIVAIAEMTPGPLGLNCAAFAGMRAAGLPGAVAASLGILSPTLTLTLTAAVFLHRFLDSRVLRDLLTGVRPAIIGMVTGVLVSLCLTNYVTAVGSINRISVAIGALDLLLLLKYKLSIPKVIALSAALGILCFGILKH